MLQARTHERRRCGLGSAANCGSVKDDGQPTIVSSALDICLKTIRNVFKISIRMQWRETIPTLAFQLLSIEQTPFKKKKPVMIHES